MLPLYLLTNAKGQEMSIELKNGEIIEGQLTNVDNWMNLTLSNVRQYNKAEDAPQVEVLESTEIYLRGTYIKYIKLQDNIIEKVKQQINSNSGNNNNNNNNNMGGNYRSGNNRHYNNSGSYRRGNNYGNRRAYNNNNNNGGSRRSYQNNGNSQGRVNNNGLGGYVQQHTVSNQEQSTIQF